MIINQLILNTDPDNFVTDEEINLVNDLFCQFDKKRTRNWIRQEYYEKKKQAKSLGISLPPGLSNLANIHLGWAAKSVDAPAKRSKFDGFTYVGQEKDPLEDVLRMNNFRNLYSQATTSELIHSCAFVTVTEGDDGEAPVIFNFYSALQATAFWNNREKRIDSGLVITDFDFSNIRKKYKEPLGFILFTDETIIEFNFNGVKWDVVRTEHDFNRPLMEPLVNNPTLTRPFGTSRINRSTMSIIDRAGRCALRMDIAAEFFSAPQKYLLGAEEGVLDGSKWDAYIGNILGLTSDENGEKPTFGQLPQMSIEPLVGQMRSLAAEFSGETDIPLSSLGIIYDNPSSAEGIYATKEDLIMTVEDINENNGNSLINIGLLAHMIMNNVTDINDLSDDLKSITPKFKNPARPSVVSQSDAIIKQVSAIPDIGKTTVALEQLGYDKSDILRMQSEWQRGEASDVFLEVMNRVNNTDNTEPEGGNNEPPIEE